MRPLAEFAVVFSASLLLLFVVIPAGTAETDNFGLSPRMLPIVCATIIALMSVVTLVFGLLRGNPDSNTRDAGGFRGVIQFGAAALAGVVLVDLTGLVIGGAALVLLSCLAVGERRIAALAGMGTGALLILLFVDWSGL
ncbi:tripartite tricarboxylate transporter TctB family protein [Roseibium marinum]|uniref:Tripartite tricarboxylate transporter TctB family protein n=2 Tax=Roseibium marinum TaxID=281252 RepID=A0A2S3V1H3_9HYPH|nr:tripartite tricarboxylate transporter TctB family protein [Roseibium marinum]